MIGDGSNGSVSGYDEENLLVHAKADESVADYRIGTEGLRIGKEDNWLRREQGYRRRVTFIMKKIGIIILPIILLAFCTYGYITYVNCEVLLLTENPDSTYLFEIKLFGIMEVTKGAVVYDTQYGGKPIYKIQEPTTVSSYDKDSKRTNKLEKRRCLLNYQQIREVKNNILKLQEEKEKIVPENRWDVSGGWLVKAKLSDGEYYSLVWNKRELSQTPTNTETDLFYNTNLLELLSNMTKASPIEIT